MLSMWYIYPCHKHTIPNEELSTPWYIRLGAETKSYASFQALCACMSDPPDHQHTQTHRYMVCQPNDHFIDYALTLRNAIQQHLINKSWLCFMYNNHNVNNYNSQYPAFDLHFPVLLAWTIPPSGVMCFYQGGEDCL